jgi:hypothetical protein
MTIRGVDVSEYNTAIPWASLAGIGFVGVRVSHGGSIDPSAVVHLRAATAIDVEIFLGYGYITDAPAEVQAKALLDGLAGVEAIVGPAAIAIDLEDLPGRAPWPRAAYRSTARAVLEQVHAAKERPIAVYLSAWFAHELGLRADPWWATWPLWLADWTPPYIAPAPWTEATILQHGVRGGLDRDCFEGDAGDFRRVFGLVARDEDAGAG